MKLSIENYTYTVANIYAPNEDKPKFFQKVFSCIKELDSVYNVVRGDFNVALDPLKDQNENKWYNNKSNEVIKEWMNYREMVNIWRINNPESKRFTWVKTNPRLTWSRIDYFLISSYLINLNVQTEIVSCIHSNHSAIV